MAQIRKYQSGGTPKKYGTFTIDNKTYDVDDDFITQLSSYARTLDSGTGAQFQHIIDAVKSGKNLTFNSSGDGSLLGDVNFDLTDKQKKRMEKGRSATGTLFGNLWGGQEQQARLAVSALKGFNYSKPTSQQVWDWSDKLNVEYEKDDTGDYILNGTNKKFINGANNTRVLKRLRSLGDIVNYGDDVEFIGYNDLDKQSYIDFYKNMSQQLDPNDATKGTKIDALIKRIEDGSWTNEDVEVLNDIGVFLDSKNETTTVSTDPSKLSGVDKAWKTSGLDRDVWNSVINFDEDGNAHATANFRNLFNGVIKDNAFFNDDWEKFIIRLGYNPDEYSWLKGKALIGNRFYDIADHTNPDSFLYKWMHSNNGFYDLNNAGRFDEADALAEYRWDNERKYSEYNPEAHYSPYMELQDKSTRYRSLSKLYDNLPKNHQLIGYYDDKSERDLYGRPIESYVVLDPSRASHDIIDYTINPELLKFGVDDSQLWGELITDNENYNGMYGTDLGGNWTYYVDPREDRGIISIPGEFGGKNVRVPSELVAAIRTNPNFWSKLLSDKTLIDRFIKSLREGVDTGIGEDFRDFFKSLKVRDYEELGFDNETSKYLFNVIDKGWGNRHGKSASERQSERLVDKYPVKSHQKGGALFKSIGNKEDIKDIKDPKKVGTTSDVLSFDKANLSQADKLELASLIGELGSFGLSLSGVGSLAAGAAGVGSTTAQFIADTKRDGLDLGDFGNLAFGLGLDAVTLIPGAGIVAKTAKLSKAVKKSKAILETVLYSLGAKDAVISLTNIVNGNGTINDFRNLGNALMLGRGISNEYKRIKNTNYKPSAKKVSKSEADYKKEAVDEWLKNHPNNKLTDSNNPESYAEWVNKTTHDVDDYEKAFEGLNTIEEFNKNWNSKKSKISRSVDQAGSKVSTVTSNLFSSKWNPFSENYFLVSREFPSDFASPSNMPYWMKEQIGFWNTPSFKIGGKILKGQNGLKGIKKLDFSGILKPEAVLGVADYISSKNAISKSIDAQKKAIRAGMQASQQSMPTEVYSQFTDGGLQQAGELRKRNIRLSKPITSDSNQYLANQLMRDQQADLIDAQTTSGLAEMRSKYNQQLTAEKQNYAAMRDQIAFNNQKALGTGMAQLHMTDANKVMQDTANKKYLLHQIRQDHAKDLYARQQAEHKLRMANAETAYLNELTKLFESKGGFKSMSDEERKNYQSDWKSFVEDKYATEASEIYNRYLFESIQDPINNRMYQHSWIPWHSKLNITPLNRNFPTTVNRTVEKMKKGGTTKRFRNVDEQRFLDQAKATDKAIEKLNDNIIKLFIKMMS